MEEVAGFVEVDLEEFRALLDGRLQSITGQAVTRSEPAPRATAVGPNVLALYTDEVRQTFHMVLDAARHALGNGGGAARSLGT